MSYYRLLGGRPGNLTSGIFLPRCLCVTFTVLMLSVPLQCQEFLIASPSKQYAVFTNISETIFVQDAKLFLTSRRDEKEIHVVISS